MNAPARGPTPEFPIREALRSQRPAYLRAAGFSFFSGSLMLTPAWFMFEVYGRVLNSRNAFTLLMLLLLALGVYVVVELIDVVRGRVLQRAAEGVDQRLRARLFDAVFDANLRRAQGGTTQAFTDLKTLRDFIASPAVTAALDVPAALLFLVLLFGLSPWLGMLALGGVLVQVAIAWFTERKTMPPLTAATRASIQAHNYANQTLRNAQVIESMGMLGSVHRRWMALQRRFIAQQSLASDHAGFNATAARLVQTLQGSMLLGAGCLLFLDGELAGGAGSMIVASILGGRVMQPLAQLVAQWRLVVNVRDAVRRLEAVLAGHQGVTPGMPLPPPKGMLTVEQVSAAAPGSPVPILRGVSFGVRPGEVLVVIGPSAAGKSTLARLLVGVWPCAAGKVRLDGADVYHWDKAELGPYLGYLPQSIELFDGTVAENIARFGRVDHERVRAAADQVGLLPMIEALPQGFDTRIGDDGAILSGGQRQRLGLARAIYGEPRLIVLDEPNSSLDEAGEQALITVLKALKARGATIVAISHRAGLLAVADRLLVLRDGQVAMFGPRDEVLAAVKKANDEARAKLGGRPAPAALARAGGAA